MEQQSLATSFLVTPQRIPRQILAPLPSLSPRRWNDRIGGLGVGCLCHNQVSGETCLLDPVTITTLPVRSGISSMEYLGLGGQDSLNMEDACCPMFKLMEKSATRVVHHSPFTRRFQSRVTSCILLPNPKPVQGLASTQMAKRDHISMRMCASHRAS